MLYSVLKIKDKIILVYIKEKIYLMPANMLKTNIYNKYSRIIFRFNT